MLVTDIMDGRKLESVELSQPSTTGAAYAGMNAKMSVIENIRHKAKRELEFQLHAFETKARYVEADAIAGFGKTTALTGRRGGQKHVAGTPTDEMRALIAHETRSRRDKSRLINHIKHKNQHASERFPEYPNDLTVVDDIQAFKQEQQRQTRTLSKIIKNIDMGSVKQVLPEYNGDIFGTRDGGYVAGCMYMSRMTIARKHKANNPWGIGDEESRVLTGHEKEVIPFLESKQNVTRSLCNLSWHKSNSKKLVSEGGVKTLQELSKLDDFNIRLNSIVALHNLARNPDVQSQLLELYVVETIANLSKTQHESSYVIVAHCVAALCVLSTVPKAEALMVAQGCLSVLDLAIDTPQTLEVQKLINVCLLNLTTCFDDATSYPGWENVINACRKSISSPNIDLRCKNYLASALSNLSLYENHRARMISEGMVKDLRDFYGMFRDDPSISGTIFDNAESSIASTMNYLSSCTGELKSAVVRQNGVQLLVTISASKNHMTRQRCIMALNNLAMDTHGEGRAAGQVIGPIVSLSDSNNPTTRFRCTAAFRSMSSRQGSRKQMMKSNVISVLLKIIQTEIEFIQDDIAWSPSICNCTITLCNLLISTDTRARAIQGSAFKSIINLLKRKSQRLEERQICCDAILTLTATPDVSDEIRSQRTLGVIRDLLKDTDIGVIKSLVKTLKTLCNKRRTCITFCRLSPDPLTYLVPLLKLQDVEILRDILVLLSLMVNSSALRRRMVQAGTGSIVQLCGHSDTQIQMWCAALLCSLSYSPDCRPAIINAGAAKGLSIVSSIKDDVNQHRCSIAMCNLSADKSCRIRMIDDGVTTSLISLASAHHESIRFNCCKALCNLSCTVGRELDLVEAGTMPELMLTSMVRSEYPITKLICIRTIANLVADNTIDILLGQGIAWAMTSATTAAFAETDDEPLEDGLQLAGNVYCVLAKYESGIAKLIEEPGVLRSLAVLMQSANPDTRADAWSVLRDACQYPCQGRLMKENFLQTLKNMNVESSVSIARNIANLLTFLFRDTNIRRNIAVDGIGVVKKIYTIDDDDTTLLCAECLGRLCCDKQSTKEFIKENAIDVFLELSKRSNRLTRSLVLKSIVYLTFEEVFIGPLVEQNVMGVISALASFTDNSVSDHTKLIAVMRSLVWGHPKVLIDGFGVIDVSQVETTEENSLHCRLEEQNMIGEVQKIWSELNMSELSDTIQNDISAIFCNLVYNVDASRYGKMLKCGIVPILLHLARRGTKYAMHQSIATISNLAIYEEIRKDLIDAGVVEAIVKILHDRRPKQSVQDNCIATLCNLSSCKIRGKFMVSCGVYDLCVAMGKISDEFIRTCCGKILTNLSVHAENTADGSVAALLDLCMPEPNDTTLLRKSSSVHETTIRELDHAVFPSGTWVDAHNLFVEAVTIDRKISETLSINFSNDGDTRESGGKWVKEDAGSASGAPPGYPEMENNDVSQMEEMREGMISRKQALAEFIEEDTTNGEGEATTSIEILRFGKVKPQLTQGWYDPNISTMDIGKTDSTFDENYDQASDAFEGDDDVVLDTTNIRERKISTGKQHDVRASPGAKVIPATNMRSNIVDTAIRTNNIYEHKVEEGYSGVEILSNTTNSLRPSSQSVSELMTDMNTPSTAGDGRLHVSFGDGNSSIFNPDDEIDQIEEPPHLLEAQSRPVSTPSLHFVDNALSAGLWSETPKIKWDADPKSMSSSMFSKK